MLNDFFLLQFLLTVTLLLFFYISENFFFILNAVTYLTAISALLWLHDLDIFVNFLVIIDLGVFFVLIAILVNVSSLFQNTYLFSLLNKLVFMLPFLFVWCFLNSLCYFLIPFIFCYFCYVFCYFLIFL